MNPKEAMNQSMKNETVITVVTFPSYFYQLGEVSLIITPILQLRNLKQREGKVNQLLRGGIGTGIKDTWLQT